MDLNSKLHCSVDKGNEIHFVSELEDDAIDGKTHLIPNDLS